jgi:hypothetical protein
MKRSLILAALLVAGCQANKAPPRDRSMDAFTLPHPAETVDAPKSWATISSILGRRGVYAHGVYTITVPRDDLYVSTDIGDVPTAAGIETTIYFFKCACGRMSVAGRFVVTDYEANDVIAELQTNGTLNIASLGPLFLREKPRLLAIQFQGEGEPDELAKIIKHALDETGDERFKPATAPLPD